MESQLNNELRNDNKENSMKFKLVKQESLKANFTSLQGYVGATRDQLVAVFGEPYPIVSSDGKVTTEWIIEFADKTIATIYDYKRYELGAPKSDELYEWHIGGHTRRALENAQAAWIAANTVAIPL
jgi:hypothetical protein